MPSENCRLHSDSFCNNQFQSGNPGRDNLEIMLFVPKKDFPAKMNNENYFFATILFSAVFPKERNCFVAKKTKQCFLELRVFSVF